MSFLASYVACSMCGRRWHRRHVFRSKSTGASFCATDVSACELQRARQLDHFVHTDQGPLFS
jgi:hypothetical protein